MIGLGIAGLGNSSSFKPDGQDEIAPRSQRLLLCFKWLTIKNKKSINKNGGNNEEDRQEEVREGAASRLLQPRYHLHHLDNLTHSHPQLMPAQTPQLLLQIGRHQQEENQQGEGFSLRLGISCQM